MKIKAILVPTDFSNFADAALQLAGSLARDHAAQLLILHVAPVPTYFSSEGIVPPLTPIDLKPLQKRLSDIIPAAGDIFVKHLLLEGDPVEGILASAEDTQCDLIVMGTHGRTGFGRLLMGSVAEQIVRRATCPVLTVKTPFVEHAVSSEGSNRETAAVTE